MFLPAATDQAARKDDDMSTMTKTVTIESKPVGVNFALVGVIRDARTGRKLGETGPRPFAESALADARGYAAARGWIVQAAD